MTLILSWSMLATGGCTFGAIVAKNAAWLFHRPAPAPRADHPRSDDARLSVLWVGHATVLVQLDDRYVLTDPVFTELVGGFSRRLVAVGLRADALPGKLTVLVSHRHFDHLSRGTFSLIGEHTDDVLVPAGAAADIPAGPYATHELAWWTTWERDGLRITAVPAAHDGKRLLHDGASHPRAFGGYVIEYHGLAVYFAGDTAYDAALFEAVARRFPRLDLALVPIAPIKPDSFMRPHHLDPTQALDAFSAVGARLLVPMHFATFLHSFDRPGEVERAFDAALGSRPALHDRALRLHIGERRVLLPVEAVSHAPLHDVLNPKSNLERLPPGRGDPP
jgi:L-ascorbate metabolism protein UlaG (beta-lactamase superfamily)